MILRRSATIALAFVLFGCGERADDAGTTTTAPESGRIALSTGASTVTVARGSTARLDLALTRTSFSGAIVLSTEPLPTGVSVTFEPSTIAQGATSATITVAAGPNASPGAVSIVVVASGTGVTTSRLALSVTIPSSPSQETPTFTLLSTSPASLHAQFGQTVTSTFSIGRGNGFEHVVGLSTSGVPAGVQATFAPNFTTATSSTLTFVVSSGAPVGTFPITVTAVGGATTATLSLSLTITAATGGGSGTATWSFCDPDFSPSWFVAQSSPGGAWTRVTPVVAHGRQSYNVTVGPIGGVAYAVPRRRGGMDVTVVHGSRADLNRYGALQCSLYRPTQTLRVAVSGLSNSSTQSQLGMISVGGGTGLVGSNETVEVTHAPIGATDLLAQRLVTTRGTFGTSLDRIILRRNVTYAGQIPALDFSSSEAFTPATAQLTVANVGKDSLTIGTILHTARGVVAGFAANAFSSTSTHPIMGLPTDKVQLGDLHEVSARAAVAPGSATSERIVTTFNQFFGNRTVTLGAVLRLPTVTVQTTPYRRYTASGAWQADYADLVSLSVRDPMTSENSWTVGATRHAFGSGAEAWTLSMPDFTGVSGFNPAWALGPQAQWSFSARGASGEGPMGPINGTVARSASLRGW